jgi:hypothetical protein
VKSAGVAAPVLQLGLRGKLIERRIDFDGVEKPDILFQLVVTCVIKDPSPVIVVPQLHPKQILVVSPAPAHVSISCDNKEILSHA